MSVNIGRCSIIVLSIVYMNMVAIAAEPDQDAVVSRWGDERRITDWPIWSLLIKDHGFGNSGAEWSNWGGKPMVDPKRKASLKKLLAKYPNSEYADDAALLLARAKLFYDDNPEEAVKGLYQVITDYPDGEWIAEDPIWLGYLPGMFRTDKQGNRTPRPIRNLSFLPESPALKYLSYLETNPHRTVDEAKYWIAKIILMTDLKETRYQEAIRNLQEVVNKYNKPPFARRAQDIENLGFMKESSFSVREIKRAEQRCHLLLVETYFDQKDYPNTIKAAEEFLAIYDGSVYCSFMYLYVGESCEALQQWDKAVVHYEQYLSMPNTKNSPNTRMKCLQKLKFIRQKMM